MTLSDAPLFSIIVPTRGRPDGLRRLLDSFKATTAHLDSVEVILVIDTDDGKTIAFVYDDFPLKRVVVQPGLKMGALNMAGYNAAIGDYIMLLNDDVVLRTQAWDEKILGGFKTFSDKIVLVHVNDKIFGEKLCTFPFLSREYCEIAGGICPEDYVRYRIDDHVYNVFNLLAVMGRIRILYLPDVVFEHTNYFLTTFGGVEYRPDERIHEIDTKRFAELLPERKELALRLMNHIDAEASRSELRIRQDLLKPIVDSVALRRPEYVRFWSDGKSLSSDNTRVTIGIVSANLRSDHARTCIDLVKKFTKNFELIILDNNGRSSFNHPHEMNKLLSVCDTDYLVVMDDDVFVEPGWLDGMLRCVAPSAGVVTPLHKDRNGSLSYAGLVMRPDYSGHHTHSLAVPDGPTRIQTLCSAVMLIDMSKCGHLRFNESYSKYFLDIDFGLQVWSTGYEVVCSPYVAVTHIGGATLQQGSPRSAELFEIQRQHFVRQWVETGKYRRLEQEVWSKIPEILSSLDLCLELDDLINQKPGDDCERFRERALNLFRSIKRQPVLAQWAAARVWDAAGNSRPAIDDPALGHLGFLLGCTPQAVLVEQNVDGLNVVFYNTDYYAIPQTEGAFDYGRVVHGDYSRCYRADSLDVLKARIRGGISEVLPAQLEAKRRRGRVQGLWQECLGVCHTFTGERARLGSWQPAFRSVGKPFVKKQIISIFGVRAFVRLKDVYGKVKEEKYKRRSWLPALWLGTKLALGHGARFLWTKLGPLQPAMKDFLNSDPRNRSISTENADPQRWLSASPITLVDPNYRGYSIYRFEYKFFAVTQSASFFNYQDFQEGKYNSCVVGHSLGEVRGVVDQLLRAKDINCPSRGLVFACLPPPQLKPILDRSYPAGTMTLLIDKNWKQDWEDYSLIVMEESSILDWARSHNPSMSDPLSRRLIEENFEWIIIPWSFPESWVDNFLETTASRLSRCAEVIHFSGERRSYRGENLHRLAYNKAYLASMFQVVPPPQEKTILEAGCSDGLVCDIVALAGAKKVFGIDVMKTVGCGFPNARIDYQVMDICRMCFPDQMFDIVYSIATFEHLANPYQAFLEMLRVTKVGGYAYVQAGPLYHSPFGHHMFEYFKDYPWIHLRKSKDEIISYAKERGIDKSIEQDLSLTCEQYVYGMLNVDHVNGFLLKEYRLEDFKRRNDIEILKFNISYEGGELLTPEIAAEIPGLSADRLVEHGFEIAFRRII